MKNLILTYNFPPTIGGIETYSKFLINYLKEDEDYDFIYPKNEKSNNVFLRALGIILFNLKTLSKIFLRNYKLIQITSLNLWPVVLIYLLFHKDCKVLINIWGLELVYENKKGLLPKIYKLIYPLERILKNKNINFLISSSASRDLLLKKEIDDSRILYLPLGVEVSDKKIIKNVNNEKYFLFVGRNVPRKGMSWFSNEILNNYKNFKMYAVGPIIDKEELNRASRNPNFKHLGTVSDEKLSELRRNAFCTVVPNIFLPNEDDFEAFCFATIEAVADKSIVIASDYQGISDALKNGLLGYLSKPSDIDSWKETIDKLLIMSSKDKEKIIEDRFKILKNELSWNIIIENTKNIHRNLVEVSNE